MLPPLDNSVLQNNPEFATLYSKLTTVILDSDGSTRNDAGAKESNAAKQRGDIARHQGAKSRLLAHVISTTAAPLLVSAAAMAAAPRTKHSQVGVDTRRLARSAARPNLQQTNTELPAELLDLILLLPPLLHLASERGNPAPAPAPSFLSKNDMNLLLSSPPFTSFSTYLPELATFASETLQALALGLARVTHPSTNPSFLHRTIPSLATHIATLQGSVALTKTKLLATRQETVTALVSLLDQQATALVAFLRTLETKHGPIARSLELRAAEVALTAQAGEWDVHNTLAATRQSVYPPEAVDALRNYSDHLRNSKGRLNETLREKHALLQDYGVDGSARRTEENTERRDHESGKERALREIARVYRDTEKQLQHVQCDLARLSRT
ncbi:hypothetical protein SPI_07754 [Niveomyces insectorum RCEF 264]|uniref:Uncharacterized protein n=1 Tax=Niveomyces insectorum RCEF 264 TaxID=1081102 RepID=A0A167P081_9HYPO|nr:hypothetical protein SPI_07754 [Niveomyces insectorum RCEF 264]